MPSVKIVAEYNTAVGGGSARAGAALVVMDGTTLEFQIDVSAAKHHRIALDGTNIGGTIPPPIWTGGAVAQGDSIYVHYEQDGVGGRAMPTLSTAAGGFAADCQMEISGKPNVSTAVKYTYLGTKFRMMWFRRGISII